MQNVIIWGGTGQSKVIYDAIDKSIYKIVAVFDNRELDNSPIPGVPVFQGESALVDWLQGMEQPELYFIVAIGGANGRVRKEIAEKMRGYGMHPLTVIHKTAFLAESCTVGQANQILAMSAVCADVILEDNVIINTSASVDHDCVICEGAHIGPGAVLAGEVQVGEAAFIGAGAVVLPRLKIGANAIIGAGAVVTRNVESGTTVKGNPARIN